MKIRPVRGTHDIFGNEIEKHNKIKKIVSSIAELNGFKELTTPIFELSELFSKPLGAESDVVLKEMYTFEDRNSELLTLRPEYTTPMIRAAISNRLIDELPLKLFGLGQMFRRERPQKGRYRQFNQINFEIFGSSDYLADLEIILIASNILKKILPNRKIVLHLNSLGTKENLYQFKKELSNYFMAHINKLSDESKNRIESNPIRILDSKNEEDIAISNQAPSIKNFLSKESLDNYENLKKSLNLLNIEFQENEKLVRGLDYYCETVFEFKTGDLGTQDTLLGGGRYDGLIGFLGGPDIPGIGWAAGIERLSMLMEYNNTENNSVHLAITDENYKSHLIKLINYLNENNIPYNWNYKYNLKKSLSKNKKMNSKKIIIIGQKEFEENCYTLKNLLSGKQIECKIEKLYNLINDKS